MWAELQAKEASMKELVRLAEEAEAAAKGEMAALLDSRNAMLEAMAMCAAHPVLADLFGKAHTVQVLNKHSVLQTYCM